MTNLIPMAGLGNRFFQEKYKLPKPFIPVFTTPMFITSVQSFPKADRYIFIARQEHSQKYHMAHIVNEAFGKESRIVAIENPTEGQACTCLLAYDLLDKDDGLFIASCDYEMVYDKKKYAALLNDNTIDVIIWTFRIGSIKKANPDAFAYCRADGIEVQEVVEKRTISDNPFDDPAVVGSFTYKRGELFLRSAQKMIRKNIRVNGEFYVATSINELIKEGLRVVTFDIDQFISFGNPFELQSVYYWQEFFNALEDHPYKVKRFDQKNKN